MPKRKLFGMTTAGLIGYGYLDTEFSHFYYYPGQQTSNVDLNGRRLAEIASQLFARLGYGLSY